MGRLSTATVLGAVALVLVGAPPAGARTVDVAAAGNAFQPGSLKFEPAQITIAVGDTVRWTNTDPVVPHTATEDQGLWDLTGTYGMTPANPPGFGPGEKRSRVFEAGTQRYFCRVHPEDMKGTIAVPVQLSRERRGKKKTRVIRATWAPASAAKGLVYDVERRRANGSFTPLRTGTTNPTTTFRSGAKGTAWQVRARLRRSGGQEATDWSPVATLTS